MFSFTTFLEELQIWYVYLTEMIYTEYSDFFLNTSSGHHDIAERLLEMT